MTHWLLIGGMNCDIDREKMQWKNLKEYMDNNNSKIEIFLRETGDIYERVAKLVCKENYNDLKLDVNSMFSGSIKRVSYKPKNIVKTDKDINWFLGI